MRVRCSDAYYPHPTLSIGRKTVVTEPLQARNAATRYLRLYGCLEKQYRALKTPARRASYRAATARIGYDG